MIWTADESEAEAAKKSKELLEKSGLFKSKPLVTKSMPMAGWMFEPSADSEQRWAALNNAAWEKVRPYVAPPRETQHTKLSTPRAPLEEDCGCLCVR